MESTRIINDKPHDKLIPMCGDPAAGECALWRKVFTMEEAATLCAVHRSTLTRYALAGDLVTHLIGQRRMVDEYHLARFIEMLGGLHHEDQRMASAIVQSPGDLNFPRNRVCAKVEGNGLYICPKALTFKEAASAIRIHPANLAKFVASGALKSVKIGKSRRVFAYELWLFFDKRKDGKDASMRKEAC